MFWTRAILWKIIKVLGYLIGMVRYFPARKKNYFFCPILDTSTRLQTYVLLEHGKKRNEPQNASIYHGSFWHWRDAQYLYTHRIWGCAGRIAASSQCWVVTTFHGRGISAGMRYGKIWKQQKISGTIRTLVAGQGFAAKLCHRISPYIAEKGQ